MNTNREEIIKQINEISKKVKIKEGINGIKRFLAVLDRYPNKPIKFVAQKSGFPTPISVAIKNELIKIGWCEKTPKGNKLSFMGIEAVKELTKVNFDLICNECDGIGFIFEENKFEKELKKFKYYASMRGAPKTVIDQSFATAETNLRRILFMNHNYDLIKDNYAFIGDSDLTSLLLSQFLKNDQQIVVFDIDERLKEIIDIYNKDNGTNIKFVHHDFRNPIPSSYRGIFDIVLTDPPYTKPGVSVFVSRAIEILNPSVGGVVYLSFGKKPPQEMLNIQKDLLTMNCLITHVLPRFNKYIGAQILAGESVLYRLEALPPLKPIIKGQYRDKLYTGDFNPKNRIYVCISCKNEITIGKNEKIKTIEELKKFGCPYCKNNKFKKRYGIRQK